MRATLPHAGQTFETCMFAKSSIKSSVNNLRKKLSYILSRAYNYPIFLSRRFSQRDPYLV